MASSMLIRTLSLLIICLIIATVASSFPPDECPAQNTPTSDEGTWSFEQKNRQCLESFKKDKKFLIITMGPPASGKTTTLSLVQQHLEIKGKPSLSIIVDDIVSKSPEYERDIELIRKQIIKTTELSPENYEIICNISEGTYFKYRPQADLQSNTLILEELVAESHYRHIVYEITGSNGSYAWALNIAKVAKTQGFSPVIVYPIVNQESLIKRAKDRAHKIGRLPCKGSIEILRKQSCTNLSEAIKNLGKSGDIERIYTFNNNNEKSELLFGLLASEMRDDRDKIAQEAYQVCMQ